jgi:hypothetical protein
MDFPRFGMLIIGLIFFSWGALIVGSKKFYEWWRDRFWKEPNEGHLSKESLIFNRYVEAGGDMAIGAFIIYLMLFLH